ncbi:unnamed protein product [Symbiodinium microadriaticum]|nr:unnamed protein product [Symbiodinium sp. KB8]CAE7359088.1 unnamed protein product [Symbiodinium microadriaticum]
MQSNSAAGHNTVLGAMLNFFFPRTFFRLPRVPELEWIRVARPWPTIRGIVHVGICTPYKCNGRLRLVNRRPPGLDVQNALPGLPYIVDGHASVHFDAVSVLYLPLLSQALQWLPHVSKTSRTCWIALAGVEFLGCIYLPPRSSASKEERLSLVSAYFAEWDEVDAQRKKQAGVETLSLMHGCGDLNMSSDIHDAFVANIVRRGINWTSDTTVATHIEGGTLDYVWGEASPKAFSPVLHDGECCRTDRCVNPVCGELQALLDSDDLDHFPWVFRCSLMAPEQACVFRAAFSKDVDAWTVACTALLDDVMERLRCEVRLAQLPHSLWQLASPRDCRCVLDCLAAVWDSLMTLAAYCTGLVNVNTVHGRLQEELWCQLEPDMWLHTGHIQEGRCEALVMVAADLAVASARQSLHLPYGTIFTDRKEAFDSQWRVPILVKLAEHVSEARVWCIADDLLRTTSMSVVRPGMRSRRFTMSVGTVEGRKLSPLQFCLAQANPGKTAQTCLWGVGINQPMEAVTAFHEHQDGSTDGTYDIAVAGCVLDMIHDGTLSWDQAMRSASSDAERLALLDGASTISRALRSFVDDTRVAVASWGQAAVAVDLLERVASEDQYVYTQGKNKVVVNSSAKRRPLQLHGSQVEFADQHVQLGVVLDTRYDGRSHLHHILSRGSSKMYLLMLELSMLGLPMHALLLSVRARLLPSVAFGVELVVHILCSEKQLNSMQASWMKKITGCALVPRAVLLWELGFHDRLSAIAWARAIMLRRRSATDPRYGHENSILSYAEVEPSSWPAAVQAAGKLLRHVQKRAVAIGGDSGSIPNGYSLRSAARFAPAAFSASRLTLELSEALPLQTARDSLYEPQLDNTRGWQRAASKTIDGCDNLAFVSPLRQAMHLALSHIQSLSAAATSVESERDWKLWLFLPRMLLFRPRAAARIPAAVLPSRAGIGRHSYVRRPLLRRPLELPCPSC